MVTHRISVVFGMWTPAVMWMLFVITLLITPHAHSQWGQNVEFSPSEKAPSLSVIDSYHLVQNPDSAEYVSQLISQATTHVHTDPSLISESSHSYLQPVIHRPTKFQGDLSMVFWSEDHQSVIFPNWSIDRPQMRQVNVEVLSIDDLFADTHPSSLSDSITDHHLLSYLSVDTNRNSTLEVSKSTIELIEGDTFTDFDFWLGDASTGTVTVRITKDFDHTIPVKMSVNGTPLASNQGTTTFTAGTFGRQNAQRISLTTTNEDILRRQPAFNGDDVEYITLQASGPGYDGSSPVTITLQVKDEETGGLKCDDPSNCSKGMYESDNPQTQDTDNERFIKISLTQCPHHSITVTLNATFRNPALADKLEILNSPLVFDQRNCKGSQNLRFRAKRDLDSNDEERIHIQLLGDANSGGYAGMMQSLWLTIEDDFHGEVVVDPENLTVAEGGNKPYKVSLNTQPPGTVTVSVSGASGEITIDTDATTPDKQTTPLTFTTTNWNSPQTVTIYAAEDDDAYHDTVTLTNTSSDQDFASANVKVTIDDPDKIGVVVNTNKITVQEEGDPVNYTVQLSQKPSKIETVSIIQEDPVEEVTVDTHRSNLTQSVSQKNLTFTPDNWDTPQDVWVRAGHDDDAADDVVILKNKGSWNSSGPQYDSQTSTVDVTVTVNDNETPSLRLTPSNTLEALEGRTKDFTLSPSTSVTQKVTLCIPKPQHVTITSRVDANGCLLNPSDELFSFKPKPSNDLTFSVSFFEDDDTTDDLETITITAYGGEYEGITLDYTFKKIDDDKEGLIVEPTEFTIDEDDHESYAVRLATIPTGDVYVAVGGASGEVTIDTDPDTSGKQTTPLTFTTSNWNEPQAVQVFAGQDQDGTDDSATLTNQASGSNYDSTPEIPVKVTVKDDDVQELILLTVEEVKEGDPDCENLYIQLSHRPLGGDVELEVSGPVPAIPSLTVSQTSAKITQASGDIDAGNQILLCAVWDDNTVNEEGVLTVEATGGGFDDVSGKVTVRVIDQGLPPKPAIEVSKTSLKINEGDADTYDVHLGMQPSGNVQVTISSDNDDITVDTDRDQSGHQSTLSFTTENWKNPQSVTVMTASDKDAIDDKAKLSHQAAGGEYQNTSAEVSVTVVDSDVATLEVTPTALTVDEDGDAKIYKVKLATTPSAEVTVTVDNPSGKVMVDTDPNQTGDQNTLTFTTDNWDAFQEVTVKADSDDDTSDDRVTLTNTASGGDYGTAKAVNVIVTVKDSDTPALMVSLVELDIVEEKSTRYTVRLATQPGPSDNVTVRISASQGEVTVDTDLVQLGNQSTLRFNASNWDQTQDVRVHAGHDDDTTNDIVTLTNSAEGGDYGAAPSVPVTVNVTDNDQPELVVDPQKLTVLEESSHTYNVKLATLPSQDVTVTVSGMSGEVTVDTNPSLTGNQSTLTFTRSNWNSDQTVTVVAGDDSDRIKDDATLTNTASGGEYATATPIDVEVTVTDNDNVGLVVTPLQLDVTEGTSSSYKVNLATAPLGTVRVSVSGASEDVAVDTDLDASGDQPLLEFTATNWDKPQSVHVSVEIDEDAMDDPPVTLTNTATGANYGSADPVNVRVTVDDKDTPSIRVSQSSLSIKEESTMSYTVRLSTQPTATVTIDVSVSEGQVAIDTDPIVTGNQSSLTFTTANWDQPKSIMVLAGSDEDAINDQVTLTHDSSGGDYDDADPVIVAVTVNDDEDVAIQVSKSSLTINEGSTGNYTVSLSSQPSSEVTVNITGAQKEVTVDADAVTSGLQSRLVFSTINWNDPKTVTVSAMRDDDAKNEHLTLTHKATGGDYGSAQPVDLKLTINDTNEPKLFTSPTSLNIQEGHTGSFTVKLSTVPISQVTVTVNVLGTGIRLENSPTMFTLSDQNQIQKIDLYALKDDDALPNDRVSIQLNARGGEDYDGVIETIEVTIDDVDQQRIEVSEKDLTIQEGGPSSTFNVQLSSKPLTNITVAISGHENSDIDVSPNRLTFTPTGPQAWNVPQSVTLTAVDDPEVANQPNITLTLNALGSSFEPASVEVEIIYDDKVVITIEDTSVREDAGLIQVPVFLSAPLDQVVTVQYQSEDGSARTGEDYTSSRGVVIFDPGGTQGVIQFVIADNEEIDGDKTFYVKLEHPSPSQRVIIGDHEAIATIIDDEGSASVTIDDAMVSGGNGFLTFNVHLSHPSPYPITVQYHTQDGTATAGQDYALMTGELRFDPGMIQQTIEVSLLQDDQTLHEKTFFVHLESSDSVRINKSVGQAVILNDDPFPIDSFRPAYVAYTARFIRTASVHLTEALLERLQPMAPTCSATQRSDIVQLWHANSTWTPSLGELLSGCRISQTTAVSGGSFGIWGRGAFRRFSSRDDESLTIHGDVSTAMLGADYRWNAGWLFGMMISHSQGDGSFEFYGIPRDINSSLTGIYPYVSYEGEDWRVWMGGGYGQGDFEDHLLDEDLTSTYGSLGLRGHLASVNSTQVDYFGDVLYADGKIDFDGIRVEVVRVRLGMETAFRIADGILPFVEANIRQDGGDAETGVGLEVGGGVRIAYPQWSLHGDLRSQSLILHSTEGFTEWGVSGSIQFGHPSKGLMIRLRPSYGLSQGMSLYRQQTILDANPPSSNLHRTDVELAYGIPLSHGTARSIVGVTQLSSGQVFRLGGELRPWEWMSVGMSGLTHYHNATFGNVSIHLQSSLKF